MALVRSTESPLTRADALAAAAAGGVRDEAQPKRAYDSLIADGLIVEFEESVRLP